MDVDEEEEDLEADAAAQQEEEEEHEPEAEVSAGNQHLTSTSVPTRGFRITYNYIFSQIKFYILHNNQITCYI